MSANQIDLTTLAAVKQWANVGIKANQNQNVPASSPYVIQTNAQTNIQASYQGGGPLVEVATAPSQGQYVFSGGYYEFAAADAGEGVSLNYIATTNDDQQIQDCITAFSAYVLHLTGRGPMDGSFPTESPFIQQVQYDDFYDGTGTPRLQINNWPVGTGGTLIINGQTVPQSVNVNTSGWLVDGDKRFISLRGGYSPFVATFQNYRYQRGGGGGLVFPPGIQNVEFQYPGGFAVEPADLEIAARKTVALNYVRRGWIGQRSQSLAQGGGTVTFGTWEMDEDVKRTIFYYARRTG